MVRMTQQSIPGVEFWCLNTDAQVSPKFRWERSRVWLATCANDRLDIVVYSDAVMRSIRTVSW